MGIHRNSRYTKTKVYNVIDEEKGVTPIFSRRRLLKLDVGSEIIKHQVKEGETPDFLAYKYLGDSALWWAILDLNPRYFTPFDIKPGDILIIPTPKSLRRAIHGL